MKCKEKEEDVSHSQQLDRLKQTDPSFYRFLESQDLTLLEFEESDDEFNQNQDGDNSIPSQDEGQDGDSVSEHVEKTETNESNVKTKQKVQTEGKKTFVLSINKVDEWSNSLKKLEMTHFRESIFALHDITRSYFFGEVAGKTSNIEESMTKTREGFVQKSTTAKPGVNEKRRVFYTTRDWKVVRILVQVTFLTVPKIISKRTGFSKDLDNKNDLLSSEFWKKEHSVISLYISSLTKMCSSLTDKADIVEILEKFPRMFIYASLVAGLSKSVIEAFVGLLSNQDDEVRIQAFSCITKCLNICPKMMELVLWKTVTSYMEHTKRTIYEDGIKREFLAGKIVELVKMNPTVGYQKIYNGLRRIAVSLRDAITCKSKKMYQEVYQWRVIGLIDLWFECMAQNSNDNKLTPLVYPLVEVTLALLNLSDNPTYLPTHIHFLRSILRVTGRFVYIPLFPQIFKMIHNRVSSGVAPSVTTKAPVLRFMTHVPANVVKTKEYKDALFDEIYDVLLEYFASYSCTISFPELCFVPIHSIRRLVNLTKDTTHSKQLSVFLKKMEETSDAITRKRESVSFSPGNIEKAREWESANLVSANGDPKENPIFNYFKQWRESRNKVLEQIIEAHRAEGCLDK